MPDFIVRSRKTMPIVDETITATSRETAIHQVVQTAAEGEEIEVLDAKEVVPAAEPVSAAG